MELKINLGIANDHAGYKLKLGIKNYIEEQQGSIVDYGTDSEDSVDYPDYAKKLVDGISQNTIQKGILICSTGIGMSIYANRFNNIRAALCFNKEMGTLAKEHNDANILVFGSKYMNTKESISILNSFLYANFIGNQHINRINKLHI
ncbi:MAG: ribose 5-phosphate isomerase B [Candidatus Midichloriaceae bacterium]